MSLQQPELRTARLLLRPFRPADADAIQVLAADREIAMDTVNVPHPYEREHAVEWIAAHAGQLEREEAVTYAITQAEDRTLLGAVALILDPPHDSAELGYWIGKPYWGRGYATEAGRAVVGWAFDALALHRIRAGHFRRNRASGKVLQKIGMRYEGRLRGHVKKWGEYQDLELYAILWDEMVGGSPRPLLR